MNTNIDYLLNTITCGNCIDVMQRMPGTCVDFILTDPPYITRYKDRTGRSLANDDSTAWLESAFAGMFRLLKRDAFCVSFYGWPKADFFMTAWRKVGFRTAGHLVFPKRYTSKSAFLQYRHEQAYLLVKGNPAFPTTPLPDVIDWVYTGNTLHPTQKPTSILKHLIRSFSKQGDIVLDPFAGSGSTAVAAQALGRRYVGIEMDTSYHRTATERLARIAEERTP